MGLDSDTIEWKRAQWNRATMGEISQSRNREGKVESEGGLSTWCIAGVLCKKQIH